jgi:hypothetical protein
MRTPLRMPANAIAAPAEFALACACAVWPPSSARNEAVAAAARDVDDWERFVRIVRRHRLEGLAHNSLMSAGVALPPRLMQTLFQRAALIAQRSLIMARESARLQAVFDGADIANLVLKGSAVTALAYQNHPVKQAWDIDIVVPSETVESAIVLMAREGYRLVSPSDTLTDEQLKIYVALGREFILAGPGQIFVELKWSLDQNRFILPGVSANSPSQVVAGPGGAAIRTLSKDDLFAYICVHGARHSFSRLKWLADIGAILAPESDEEIVRLYRAADARGAGRCAAEALLLCRHLLKSELPLALVAELEADPFVIQLARASIITMAGGDGEQELTQRRFSIVRVVLSHFLLGKSLGFLGVEVRLKWVSARDHMNMPLPAWASFLYPIIRLPLMLWRRVKYMSARS